MSTSKPRNGRRSGNERSIRLCGEWLHEPGHICAFFDSRAEKYAAIGPYFNDALDAGDTVINVVDAAARQDHLKALSDARVPVDPALQSGRLRVMTTEETYLRGGSLDLDGMLDMLRETLREADAAGTRIRTCGEMSWIARDPGTADRVMDYEARVNQFVPTFDCTLLCVYDVAKTPPAVVADILATHPFAIVKGRLRRNEYFVEPDQYLGMLRTRPARVS